MQNDDQASSSANQPSPYPSNTPQPPAPEPAMPPSSQPFVPPSVQPDFGTQQPTAPIMSSDQTPAAQPSTQPTADPWAGYQPAMPPQPSAPVFSGLPQAAMPPTPQAAPQSNLQPTTMQPWAAPANPASQPLPAQPGGFTGIPAANTKPAALERLRQLPRSTLLLVGGIVVVLVVLAVLATQLIHGPVSSNDVSSALTTATNLDNDVLDAVTTYNSMYVGSDASDSTITTSVNTINGKLDDAQKQLDTLKNSAVLHDATVSQKFNAYHAKLTPYLAYIKDNTADNKVLMPIVNTFSVKIQKAITDQPQDIAAVNGYLDSLKNIVDSTSDQLNHITVKSDTNKRGVAALKTFLTSTSSIISTTRSDVSAGKDIFAIDNDLFKMSDAEYTFDKAVNDINNEEEANQKQLNPENAFSEMLTAITALAPKAKS